MLLVGPRLAGAPWIVLNEIHYHPPGGDDEEFVEILSREPPRADLTDWILEGEIDFRFPPGTVIQGGEHLVLAKNPEVCRDRFRGRGRILGPYGGRLDNKGGALILRNAARAIACEVSYGSRGRWPVTPDGTGHTLSLLDPLFDPANPRNWGASALVGGTPGSPNFTREVQGGEVLVKAGAVWKFWRGDQPPPEGWREAAFDDSKWEYGPSGFGFADDDDATTIEGMRGSYVALFVRHGFDVPAAALSKRLIFRVDYDDGFAAFVNGKEVARENLGKAGSEHPFNEPATALREAGVATEYDLGLASSRLAAGRNVIAIAVHNDSAKSSDLSLIPSLELRDATAAAVRPPRLVINEVRRGPNGAENFIEVYNAGGSPASLSGWFLSDEPKRLEKWRIAAQAQLAPGAFLPLFAKDLGGELPLGANSLITLTDPGGRRVADAFPIEGGGKSKREDPAGVELKGEKKPAKDVPKKPEKSSAKTAENAAKPKKAADNPSKEPKEDRSAAEILRGRFPDGSTDLVTLESASPGEANRIAPAAPVVINEILYHPITGKVEDEFIELFNRGSAAASLAGYRFTGGIGFEFPAGSSIPAGGFLVVARSPADLMKKYGLAKEKVTGPFEGQLSDGGEVLALRDPTGNLVDRVEYGDRDPWPATADGLGASLELIDPALDNSLAGSWAPSDDQAKAKWETFSYEKEHVLFQGRNFAEFQFLLLNTGECLIDEVRVHDLFNENFERGAGSWTAMGTHERSGPVADGSSGRNSAYRIVSEGRGNARHNYVSRELTNGISPGKTYRVSFRAKWQQGSPLLLTRTPGQGVARAHRLSIPPKLGTPGAENSSRKKNAPPVVGTPVQDPVAPATGQSVDIAVSISAAAPPASAVLHYRSGGGPGVAWTQLTMVEQAAAATSGSDSRVYKATIPPLPAGKVEFYIAATDSRGARGGFPAGAPARTALYAVGLAPSPKFPTYTVLISEDEWARFLKRPRMSNRLIDATLVYGDSRILYNVGLRRRGSPFTRSARNWRVVFGSERLDGRGTLTLDGQLGDGTSFRERLTYWLVDQLRAPNARQQYAYLRIPGIEEGVYEDVEKIDRDYLARWLDTPPPPEAGAPPKAPGKKRPSSRQKAALDRAEGNLHKVDDYWEILSTGERFYVEANFLFKGLDPEPYRWNFPPRSNALDEDFTPFLQLVQLFDQRTSNDKAFDERLESMVDVDEWLRVLAARTLVNDWDTIGLTRGKNAFIYRSPVDGRWRLLPWDADLSWNNPSAPLFSEKFEGIRRILKRPQYRRRFVGYLAYLADRKFDPDHLALILGDLRQKTGAAIEMYQNFAAERRDEVLRGLQRGGGLRVASARRVGGPGGKIDLVRAAGAAVSPRVMRLKLGGREGTVRWGGDGAWEAEFPIGPEGGEMILDGLEVGGEVVAREKVKITERKAAVALTPLDGGIEKPRELVFVDRPEEMLPETIAVADGPKKEATPAPGPAPDPPAPNPPVDRPGGTEKAAAAKVPAVPPAPTETSVPAGNPEVVPPGPATVTLSGSDVRKIPQSTRRERKSDAETPLAKPPAPVRVEPPRGVPLWVLATGAAAIAAILGGVALLYFRSRAPAGADGRLETLRSPHFAAAAKALKQLSRDKGAVPGILKALEDLHLTPFHKLKRGPDGLSATPAPPEAGGTIQVRHVAALLLELHIGKPAAERPTRKQWQAHWENVSNRTKGAVGPRG